MNEATGDHHLSFAAGGTLILAVLLFLLALCVYRHLQSIPADISYRVRTAVEQAGYAPGPIRVDGRDVILTGTVARSTATRMSAIVKSVPGVRAVRTDLTIVSSSLLRQSASSNAPLSTTVGGRTRE